MATFIKTAVTVSKTLAEAIAFKAFLHLSPRERQRRQAADLRGNKLLWSSCLSLRLETEVMVSD